MIYRNSCGGCLLGGFFCVFWLFCWGFFSKMSVRTHIPYRYLQAVAFFFVGGFNFNSVSICDASFRNDISTVQCQRDV